MIITKIKLGMKFKMIQCDGDNCTALAETYADTKNWIDDGESDPDCRMHLCPKCQIAEGFTDED